MKLLSPHHFGIWGICAYETFMTSSFRYKGSFVPIKLLSPHVGIRGVVCL